VDGVAVCGARVVASGARAARRRQGGVGGVERQRGCVEQWRGMVELPRAMVEWRWSSSDGAQVRRCVQARGRSGVRATVLGKRTRRFELGAKEAK
jgi:hypothetical protein